MFFFQKYQKFHQKLKSVAYTDVITGGRNEHFLEMYLQKMQVKRHYCAFISLEIINLSAVMNINGLKGAEYLIKEVYAYLKGYFENDVEIAHSHFGDFKFILCFDTKEEIIHRINNLAISKKYGSIPIQYKIGIYFMEKGKENFHDICTYVNLAKNSCGKDQRYSVYNKRMYQHELALNTLKEDIQRGIENHEFKAWYQPKYGKDGKTILGAEALVRWYKYGSIVAPYIFIPTCEENGFIQEIDELVLEDVCQQQSKWLNEGKEIVPISVNLSRNYLDRDDAVERLLDILNKYQITAEHIQFEITESSLVGNEEKLKQTLSQLHTYEFKILLDDFGIGYSSIKTIADLNFDILKVDKSFVDNIVNEKGRNIIAYTVQLSRQLHMSVVVEGIEEQEQYEYLKQLDCDMFQGYYFSKLIAATDFEKLLKTNRNSFM